MKALSKFYWDARSILKGIYLTFFSKLPILNKLLIREVKSPGCWTAMYPSEMYPPGHCYSVVPSLAEIFSKESRVFDTAAKSIPGIELNEEKQYKLLKEFTKYYDELPFSKEQQKNGLRYYYKNGMYPYSDAILLNSMIRHFKPKRVIEVGCGYSSAVMLDTNDIFMNKSIDFTFIEPDPQRLLSLLTEEEKSKIKLYAEPVQNIPLSEFEKLKENDFLFIDSSHVSKIGSDVNYVFFEILPALSNGVFIHFHDIYTNFEYTKEHIKQGLFLNEQYLLRAFLQFNDSFEIILFSSYLIKKFEDWFKEKMPLCLIDANKEFGKWGWQSMQGQVIWLRKK